MSTSFQELLRKQAEISGWKERSRSRAEWLGALRNLLDSIRNWLHEADPEGVLENVQYEVQRVEQRLGVYDAPALTVRLGTRSVDFLPVGRYSIGSLLELKTVLATQGNQERWGDLAGGRVDITNGERRHLLLRSIEGGQDRWYVMMTNKGAPIPSAFDRASLEATLLDLLS
jgi:hypothetical protein